MEVFPFVVCDLQSYRVFSLTWPASMQIYWNKRKRLHKKRVQFPQGWLGTPTWPPFHCLGTPIWPRWRHVKTLYTWNRIHKRTHGACALHWWIAMTNWTVGPDSRTAKASMRLSLQFSPSHGAWDRIVRWRESHMRIETSKAWVWAYWLIRCLATWAQLPEAWLALTSV